MIFLLATTATVAQNNQFEWASQVGGSNNDHCTAITTDAAGNIYTAGFFQGTVDFDPGPGVFQIISQGSNDVFIIKTDALGNFIWAKAFGGSSDDRPNAIVAGPADELYIAGSFAGTADFNPGSGNESHSSFGFTDGYLLQLDTAGNYVALARAGGSGADQITGLTTNGQGACVVTGDFEGTVFFFPATTGGSLTSLGSYDVFVAAFDANLNPSWWKRTGGTTADHVTSIGADLAGNIIYGGYFNGTADFDPGAAAFNLTTTGSNDIFLSGLTSTGNFSWAVHAGGTGDDGIYGLDVKSDGTIAATGYFSGTADFNPDNNAVSNLSSEGQFDCFILVMEDDGQFVWVRKAGGNTEDTGRKISFGPSGDISVAGVFTGTVDFNPGVPANNVTASGMSDGFVLQLSAVGNYLEIVTFGSAGNDAVNGVAVDANGDLFAAGSFAGTMDADPFGGANPLTPVGLIDGFFVRIGSSFTGMEEMKQDLKISVYPNPATDFIVLQPSSDENLVVSIYNVAGALVYQSEIHDGKQLRVDSRSWVPGTYHVVTQQLSEKNVVTVIISGK